MIDTVTSNAALRSVFEWTLSRDRCIDAVLLIEAIEEWFSCMFAWMSKISWDNCFVGSVIESRANVDVDIVTWIEADADAGVDADDDVEAGGEIGILGLIIDAIDSWDSHILLSHLLCCTTFFSLSIAFFWEYTSSIDWNQGLCHMCWVFNLAL